jgi:putative tryptophan/tyrosine transport system substrate-binding protein
MRRREFITLLGGAAAAWPLAARAQQGERTRRIGVLMAGFEDDAEQRRSIASFLQGLEQLGWVPGRNVQIDYRWGRASTDLMESYASELVGLMPDVLLVGSNVATTILSRRTTTIPIVFASASDPLETGLITNMARPGGNVTGFTQLETPIAGKYLELLKEIAPRTTRAEVLYNRDSRVSPAWLRAVDAAASSLGIQKTVPVPANDPAEIDRATEAFWREPNGGLVALSGPPIIAHRAQVIALAARHRLPAIYPYRFFAADGGLMTYGPDLAEQHRQAASYVDRILKGERPGDLPVQAPTKFELVINLKTARGLGLVVPPTMLARADEVIE